MRGNSSRRMLPRASRAGGRWSRWSVVVAAVAGLGAGCGLIPSEPELPLYPAAGRRPINPYGELPASPSLPIDSGEEALALALREAELLRHVQRIDAKYSGRRRRSLAWTGRAAFENTLPPTEDAESDAGEEPRSDVGEEDSGVALLRAIETDGGYWRVAVASNVRETNVYYECALSFSTRGEALVPFEARGACGWKGQQKR